MGTCEGCIYYEKCIDVHRGIQIDNPYECDSYKSKNKYINFPVIPMEKVYMITNDGEIIELIVWNIDYSYNEEYSESFVRCRNYQDDKVYFVDFKFEDVGKTVFYTEEQAKSYLRGE